MGDQPRWERHDVDGETHLVWRSDDLPIADWYWLAGWENPEAANTMPLAALDALVAAVRDAGRLAAVTAERDALRAENERLLEFVRAHDAVEHLIADHTDDRAAYNTAVDRANAARAALEETPPRHRPVVCTCPGGGEPDGLEHRPGCPFARAALGDTDAET